MTHVMYIKTAMCDIVWTFSQKVNVWVKYINIKLK